jgi:hypothetical protein
VVTAGRLYLVKGAYPHRNVLREPFVNFQLSLFCSSTRTLSLWANAASLLMCSQSAGRVLSMVGRKYHERAFSVQAGREGGRVSESVLRGKVSGQTPMYYWCPRRLFCGE